MGHAPVVMIFPPSPVSPLDGRLARDWVLRGLCGARVHADGWRVRTDVFLQQAGSRETRAVVAVGHAAIEILNQKRDERDNSGRQMSNQFSRDAREAA